MHFSSCVLFGKGLEELTLEKSVFWSSIHLLASYGSEIKDQRGADPSKVGEVLTIRLKAGKSVVLARSWYSRKQTCG